LVHEFRHTCLTACSWEMEQGDKVTEGTKKEEKSQPWTFL